MNDKTRGQKIRAAREAKRMTVLQACVASSMPRFLWEAFENDVPDMQPDSVGKQYIDRFTDGEVPLNGW